jgi:hypothetical protein
MRVEVREESLMGLEEYASISIAFEVSSILDVRATGDGLDEFVLTERCLAVPYVKDYDSIKGEKPTQWERRFDMSNWVLFGA